jgi:hypothetical protein
MSLADAKAVHKKPPAAIKNTISAQPIGLTEVPFVTGFIAWRAANPPLSDREQISAQMEEMRAAVEVRSAGVLAKNVSDDFAWNGLDARTFRASLAQAFVQWRDVKLRIPAQKTEVRGDSATTNGRYNITLREAEASAPQTFTGNFTVQWKRTQSSGSARRTVGTFSVCAAAKSFSARCKIEASTRARKTRLRQRFTRCRSRILASQFREQTDDRAAGQQPRRICSGFPQQRQRHDENRHRQRA